MNYDRRLRINELADVLWDEASDTWHPEPSWETLLLPHCKGDLALREEVIRFVRASAAEGTEVALEISGVSLDTEEECLPDAIGPYKILSILGIGGMGIVYAAEFTGPGMEARPVAVKLSRHESYASAAMRRLRAEINLLSRLSHPNIVQIYTAGESDSGLPYLVMEQIEDGSRLQDYCAGHALSLQERLALFQKVCSAIMYLHGQNIAHRDLTAGNILVTRTGEPKIIDFGLAVFLKPVPDAPTVANSEITPRRLGTPGYMSPEQERGEQGRTSDDVWALGAILNQLIADAPIDTSEATYLKRHLQVVVTRCRDEDQATRVQNVCDLLNLLDKAVADARKHIVALVLRMAQSRRARVLAAIVVIAAALGGGWKYLEYRRQKLGNEAAAKKRLIIRQEERRVASEISANFDAKFALMFKPLTKRSGSLAEQVEFSTRLANAGDLTAKKAFGIGILLCRHSVLPTENESGSKPREDQVQGLDGSRSQDEIDRIDSEKLRREWLVRDSILEVCSVSALEKGLRWLDEAANNGDAVAAALLASVFYEGSPEIPKRLDLALKWANKAIAGDHPEGYKIRGNLYAKGEVTLLNERLGFQDWEKAAAYGDILSQFRMAVLLKGGAFPGRAADPGDAYKWAILASGNDQGLLIGMKDPHPDLSRYKKLREKALALRTELGALLTQDQRDAIEQEAHRWRPLPFYPSTGNFTLEEHEAIRRSILGDEPNAK